MQRSQDLVDHYTQALRAGSSGTLLAEQVFSSSPHVLVIGTDQSEWWTGAGAIRGMSSTAQHIHDTGAEVVPSSNPVAWELGDVGWVLDQPTLRLASGREFPFRLTSVYVREGNDWKIIHQHWSIGVPNEQVEPFS